MKYSSYDNYAASGIEWAPEIPKHWRVTQIKRPCTVTLGKMLQTAPSSELDTCEPYLRAANISKRGVDVSDVREMWFSPREKAELKLLSGDLLVSEGGDVGRCALWNGELEHCYIQNAINRVRMRCGGDVRFFAYWLRHLKSSSYMDLICNKSTIAHYTAEKVSSTPCVLPTEEEQCAIADFLDRETAKIDNLIEKQERLIELLEEKRQAVITRAVTKGLNPDVRMKDSGVEWLGEVPEHWAVEPLKYSIRSFEQGWSPQCDARRAENDEYGVLKVGCVNSGVFNPDENKALPDDLEPKREYRIRRGDLLISRANTKELVGSAAVVSTDYPRLLLCDKLYRLRLTSQSVPQFVSYFLATPTARQEIGLAATGASQSMQNIGQATIRDLAVPRPPVEEAVMIVSETKARSRKLSRVTEPASQQVALLKERRTALISAAVTGKIDVRNTV